MSTQSNTNQTYTIMEAAKLSGLPESTLRYYETIGLIDKIKRGTTSKQREYTDDDINMVIGIACLNATGMSIDTMKQYLGNAARGEHAAEEQVSLLDRQRTRLLEEAHFMQLRRRYVEVKIEYWTVVKTGDKKTIVEITKRALTIANELKLPRETK